MNTTAITDDIMEWNKYEIDDYPVCIVHYPQQDYNQVTCKEIIQLGPWKQASLY